MTQQQTENLQNQTTKERSTKEQQQDIKNAEFIARVGQPNHPNT